MISGGLTYEMAPKTWSGGAADPSLTAWCNVTGTDITGAAGTAVGTGSANTTALQAVCSSGAAIDAGNLVLGGQSDWFLPSIATLNEMYSYNSSIVDTATYGFTTADYWSSSQVDATYAYAQRFSDGASFGFGKNGAASVRPVRAF